MPAIPSSYPATHRQLRSHRQETEMDVVSVHFLAMILLFDFSSILLYFHVSDGGCTDVISGTLLSRALTHFALTIS